MWRSAVKSFANMYLHRASKLSHHVLKHGATNDIMLE